MPEGIQPLLQHRSGNPCSRRQTGKSTLRTRQRGPHQSSAIEPGTTAPPAARDFSAAAFLSLRRPSARVPAGAMTKPPEPCLAPQTALKEPCAAERPEAAAGAPDLSRFSSVTTFGRTSPDLPLRR